LDLQISRIHTHPSRPNERKLSPWRYLFHISKP